MALKKSELYSSLWSSCDELRGGMDASQYKDYVLVLLFIKYVSDKYAGVPYAPITIPPGSSFKDMVALKGKSDIGDQINKKIIEPLAKANKQSDMADFNDANKLGSGKEMVDRLTNLIAIFENKALDFSKNRADGDDILGDAYEYLMRHFATESGKSKGQFYTPAEVSRVIAQILGIRNAETTSSTTVYDPACGSGSLLLKVGDEAGKVVTLYGQEKDAATSTLARMNMILHNNPTALIVQGNSLADPKFKDGDALKTFDYVVANPPFSDKRWSTGINPLKDPFERFKNFGTPPAKQGDYAYLLHIVRSLKSTGKGACILPHGVLFRGNAEADIRRALVRKGYIKAIIGLPANIFYGTGTLAQWHREQIKAATPELIAKWEPVVGVTVRRIFVQKMKTKWGSCNPGARSIRLNTDLAKKPRECLEYIVVHEMVHILEPTHNARFIALMDRLMPQWRVSREQLNQLPVSQEKWAY